MKRSGSPLVTHLEWGRIDVEGGHQFRDAKLFPDGARQWDWRETGTRHVPGVQIADVEELLERGSSAIVLSRGMDLVLQVPADTIRWLEQRGVRVEVLESRQAVARYNELREREAVGALIHTTC